MKSWRKRPPRSSNTFLGDSPSSWLRSSWSSTNYRRMPARAPSKRKRSRKTRWPKTKSNHLLRMMKTLIMSLSWRTSSLVSCSPRRKMVRAWRSSRANLKLSSLRRSNQERVIPRWRRMHRLLMSSFPTRDRRRTKPQIQTLRKESEKKTALWIGALYDR